MPHDVTLNLGTYTISSNLDKKFVLAVAASISLSLPEEYPDVQTAAELCEKVRAGSLWITRAGSCNFELGVDFNSLPSDDHRDRLENMVIGAFETFPVRERRAAADVSLTDRATGMESTWTRPSPRIQQVPWPARPQHALSIFHPTCPTKLWTRCTRQRALCLPLDRILQTVVRRRQEHCAKDPAQEEKDRHLEDIVPQASKVCQEEDIGRARSGQQSQEGHPEAPFS